MNFCPCCAKNDAACRVNVKKNVQLLAAAAALYGTFAFFFFNGSSSFEVIKDAAASGIYSVMSLTK